MPEIDIEEVKKNAAKKQDEVQTITSQVVDGKTYFYSRYLKKTFSDYGEALQAESVQRQLDDFKSRGLNEYGQNKEDALKSTKIKELNQEKEKLYSEIRALDLEIGQVKRGVYKAKAKK